MPVELEDFTLENLERHRGLGELFQEAVMEVASDIDNPNKDDKPRKISVELVFKPTPDRRIGGVDINVGTKLRPRRPAFASCVFADGNAQLNLTAEPGEDPRQAVAQFPKGGSA